MRAPSSNWSGRQSPSIGPESADRPWAHRGARFVACEDQPRRILGRGWYDSAAVAADKTRLRPAWSLARPSGFRCQPGKAGHRPRLWKYSAAADRSTRFAGRWSPTTPGAVAVGLPNGIPRYFTGSSPGLNGTDRDRATVAAPCTDSTPGSSFVRCRGGARGVGAAYLRRRGRDDPRHRGRRSVVVSAYRWRPSLRSGAGERRLRLARHLFRHRVSCLPSDGKIRSLQGIRP